MFLIGKNKCIWLKMLKILCHGHMLLVILTEKKLLERFVKTNSKKQIKNKLQKKKLVRKKCDKLYGKVMVILLTVGLMTKTV